MKIDQEKGGGKADRKKMIEGKQYRAKGDESEERKEKKDSGRREKKKLGEIFLGHKTEPMLSSFMRCDTRATLEGNCVQLMRVLKGPLTLSFAYEGALLVSLFALTDDSIPFTARSQLLPLAFSL